MEILEYINKYKQAKDQLSRSLLRNQFVKQYNYKEIYGESQAFGFNGICKSLLEKAITLRNINYINDCLILISLENGQFGERNILRHLSLANRACNILEVNTEKLFIETMKISSDEVKNLLEKYINKNTESKHISKMGFYEVNEPEFKFIYNPKNITWK